MTKGDIIKAVEDLFPSNSAALIIKCDTDDDRVDAYSGNTSVAGDKEKTHKLSDMHMENMVDSLMASY